MALQISEIALRMAVGDPPSPPSHPSAATGSGHGASLTPDQIDELVRRCVREVLASIERGGDR